MTFDLKGALRASRGHVALHCRSLLQAVHDEGRYKMEEKFLILRSQI